MHYKFDEGTDGLAVGAVTDLSGNGNTGAAADCIYKDGGPHGTYAEFVTASKVDIPEQIEMSGGVTMEGWFYIPSSSANADNWQNGMLLGISPQDSTGGLVMYATCRTGGADVEITLWGTGGQGWDGWYDADGVPEIPYDTWTYVGVTWESGSNVLDYYIQTEDGEPQKYSVTSTNEGNIGYSGSKTATNRSECRLL